METENIEFLRKRLLEEVDDVKTEEKVLSNEELIHIIENEVNNNDLDQKIDQYFSRYNSFNLNTNRWHFDYLKDNVFKLTLLESEIKRRTKSEPFYKRLVSYLKLSYNKEYKAFLKASFDDLIIEYTKQLDKVGIIYYSILKKARNTQKQLDNQMDIFTNTLIDTHEKVNETTNKTNELQNYLSILDERLSSLDRYSKEYFVMRNLRTKLFTKIYSMKSNRRVNKIKAKFAEQQYQILDLASQILSYIIMNSETNLNYILNINDTVKGLTTAFSDIKELTENMGYLSNGLKSLYNGLTDLWNSTFENVKEMRNIAKNNFLEKNLGLNPTLENNIKSLISESLELLDDETFELF